MDSKCLLTESGFYGLGFFFTSGRTADWHTQLRLALKNRARLTTYK